MLYCLLDHRYIMFIHKKYVLLGWLIVILLPLLWPFVIYDHLRLRSKKNKTDIKLFDWVKEQ